MKREQRLFMIVIFRARGTGGKGVLIRRVGEMLGFKAEAGMFRVMAAVFSGYI